LGWLVRRHPTPVEGTIRVGLCRTLYWPHASADGRAAIEAAASALDGGTIELRAVACREGFGDAEEPCWRVINFEVARKLAWEYEWRPHSLSRRMPTSIENGRQPSLDRHEGNLRRLAITETSFDAIFETVEALILPAAGEEAPTGLSDAGSPIFDVPFQIAGLPAVSLPIGPGPGGLPIGLQLVGPRFGDARLLDIAAPIERRLTA
jgi:Asp-tRNA(Asn)/Glu-tRNA(Gln) amidotransferase A subunit family amidase